MLTDIIGWEDAFCDMDCKIAGTEKGITGFQLDLKLRGLPHEMMAEALEKARVARLFILGEMAKTLAEPRKELSKYAPRIESSRSTRKRSARSSGRAARTSNGWWRNPAAKSTSKTTAR